MPVRRRPLIRSVMFGRTGFRAGVRKARMEAEQAARRADLEARSAPAPPAGPPPAPPATDIVAQLQQLKTLRDQGILDDAELEAAKRKLLGT